MVNTVSCYILQPAAGFDWDDQKHQLQMNDVPPNLLSSFLLPQMVKMYSINGFRLQLVLVTIKLEWYLKK